MIKFLTHPVWPMAFAFALYLLIAAAWAFKGRPWFGFMWLCYAGAIVALIMDTKG